MIQPIHRNQIFNPSTTVIRKSKSQQQQQQQQLNVTEKQDVIPIVKLPTIVNKISTRIQNSNQLVNIQDSLTSQKISSTDVNQSSFPKLFKPITVQLHLPNMNDHVVKENLTQKAILRCKSPQTSNIFSRSTTFVDIEPQEETKSYHPLQHMDVGSLLSESARNRLKRLFDKLDTDKDGHISYPQVQRCLPSNFPRAQLTFFRVLYDIISGATYFGLQEFYATAIIVEMVAKQDSKLWNTLLDDVDFNYYHNNIFELLEDFNNQCLSNSQTINYEQFLEFIKKRIGNNKIERISNELEYIMPKIKTMKISRLDFIALLPIIIYIESYYVHGQTLFRFQENSLLDLHIRQALLT
ncbi:unnamed protein product [Rotaria sordida]|uniref:EF-hand domain-containing protein n=1 Tax=Rotaria sordida TaxID=392033 RepID=A0A813XA35_9BILA|nr:unnamed protein product [Rotaria sordida]CAF1088742.1 unnamed protein product [Rotaria sordida]CAF1121370.1 unnamed protein product [Rotaria sordida]CAF1248549.1 unnamed protein product [Rotaria sordida]CAF3906482.1 unnamed protein product [Rotaria sordida]